jgi:ribonuclease HI
MKPLQSPSPSDPWDYDGGWGAFFDYNGTLSCEYGPISIDPLKLKVSNITEVCAILEALKRLRPIKGLANIEIWTDYKDNQIFMDNSEYEFRAKSLAKDLSEDEAGLIIGKLREMKKLVKEKEAELKAIIEFQHVKSHQIENC